MKLYTYQVVNDSAVPRGQKARQASARLFAAAQQGRRRGARLALRDLGNHADVLCTDRASPLIVAARNGHTAVVELLLEAGADIEHCDNAGITGLMAAAQSGNVDCVQLFLDRGANVNRVSDVGHTTLMTAVMFAKCKIIQLLLSHPWRQQVRLEIVDNANCTVWDLARVMDVAPVVSLLKELKVDEDCRRLRREGKLCAAPRSGMKQRGLSLSSFSTLRKMPRLPACGTLRGHGEVMVDVVDTSVILWIRTAVLGRRRNIAQCPLEHVRLAHHGVYMLMHWPTLQHDVQLLLRTSSKPATTDLISRLSIALQTQYPRRQHMLKLDEMRSLLKRARGTYDKQITAHREKSTILQTKEQRVLAALTVFERHRGTHEEVAKALKRTRFLLSDIRKEQEARKAALARSIDECRELCAGVHAAFPREGPSDIRSTAAPLCSSASQLLALLASQERD